MKKLLFITFIATIMVACTKEDPQHPQSLWYGAENHHDDKPVVEPKVFEFKNNALYINGERYYKFIEVPGGTFTMGTDTLTYHGYCNGDELPHHQVTLSTYYIGITEVSQRFWNAIMGYWTYYNDGEDLPADALSWTDCQVFVQRLHDYFDSVLDGAVISLPTEAQWEYAALGGNMGHKHVYAGSNTCSDVCWSSADDIQSPQVIASKNANELGIFDMSGNVREWCHDLYGKYSSTPQTDPMGPSSGNHHVLRGGSFLTPEHDCRIKSRFSYPSIARTTDIGCRLVLMKK